MKSEIQKKLSEKYGEKFIIQHDTYSHVLKTYQFQASPVRNKRLVFVGKHNEDLSVYSDNYVSKYLSDKYTKQVRTEIEKYSSPAYLFIRLMLSDEFMSMNEIEVDDLDPNQIIDTTSQVSCDIICYLFKELTEETKDELLTGIYTTLTSFKNHPNARISLYLYFWKPDFLNTHSLNIFEFDRQKTGFPSMENMTEKRKYVTKRLDLFFRTDKPFTDFTVDSLYKYTKSINQDSFNVSPTNLN